MKKTLSSLVAILFGLSAISAVGIAEEDKSDSQDILALCTAEAKGAIDVQDYIDDCVKEKEEEMKELAKENMSAKEKS